MLQKMYKYVQSIKNTTFPDFSMPSILYNQRNRQQFRSFSNISMLEGNSDQF